MLSGLLTDKTSGNAILGEPSLNAFQSLSVFSRLTSVSSQLYPRCRLVRAIFLLISFVFDY